MNFSPEAVSETLDSLESSELLSSELLPASEAWLLEPAPLSLELLVSLPQAAKQPTISIRTSSREMIFFMLVFLLGTYLLELICARLLPCVRAHYNTAKRKKQEVNFKYFPALDIDTAQDL